MSDKIVDTKSYSISDFIKWHQNGEIELSPKYQRSDVWDDHAKSYFIDSLIRGMPIPPIFIRLKPQISQSKVIREIIDGQQRLRTIISFYNREADIFPTHSGKKEKQNYDQITDQERETFFMYDVPVQIVKTTRDDLIYDMFSRLNSNNYTLNKQELRNAKYWGEFKSTVYSLGSYSRQKFIDFGVFKDRQLARMKDCDLIGHILVLLIGGIYDGKDATLDRFYKEYDKHSEICQKAKEQYVALFNTIASALEETNSEIFARPIYLFTLFAAVKEVKISQIELCTKIRNLESKINGIEDGIPIANDEIWISGFVELHKRHTTDRQNRIDRINQLIEYFNA